MQVAFRQPQYRLTGGSDGSSDNWDRLAVLTADRGHQQMKSLAAPPMAWRNKQGAVANRRLVGAIDNQPTHQLVVMQQSQAHAWLDRLAAQADLEFSRSVHARGSCSVSRRPRRDRVAIRKWKALRPIELDQLRGLTLQQQKLLLRSWPAQPLQQTTHRAAALQRGLIAHGQVLNPFLLQELAEMGDQPCANALASPLLLADTPRSSPRTRCKALEPGANEGKVSAA